MYTWYFSIKALDLIFESGILLDKFIFYDLEGEAKCKVFRKLAEDASQ